MRIKGLKSTREKPPDTYLEYKSKTKLVFLKTVDHSTMKEGGGGGYSELCGLFPVTSSRVDKYIYDMYLYDCNDILTTEMNNRSDK